MSLELRSINEEFFRSWKRSMMIAALAAELDARGKMDGYTTYDECAAIINAVETRFMDWVKSS